MIMNNNRSRSVSRNAIVKINPHDPTQEILNPEALLENVLKHIKSPDIPLLVELSDGITKHEILLSTLLNQTTRVIDGYARFGLKKLDTRHLRADIRFSVEVEQDQQQP
jgi:hypothetical protein